MITEVDGFDVTPKVGSYILPDNWGCGVLLQPGDSFSPFRLPVLCGGPIKDLAVRIEATGRTIRRKNGGLAVRVRITFVGDGEPDTIHYGYMGV